MNVNGEPVSFADFDSILDVVTCQDQQWHSEYSYERCHCCDPAGAVIGGGIGVGNAASQGSGLGCNYAD